jgi:hypothetical protein
LQDEAKWFGNSRRIPAALGIPSFHVCISQAANFPMMMEFLEMTG